MDGDIIKIGENALYFTTHPVLLFSRTGDADSKGRKPCCIILCDSTIIYLSANQTLWSHYVWSRVIMGAQNNENLFYMKNGGMTGGWSNTVLTDSPDIVIY